jgi:hypothetical protein
MQQIVKVHKIEWEGASYFGIVTIFFAVLYIIMQCLRKTRQKPDPYTAALLIPALVLLLFSFGTHLKLFELLNIEFTALKQFRALGRFSWYLYFVTPIFLIVNFHSALERLKTRSANAVERDRAASV